MMGDMKLSTIASQEMSYTNPSCSIQDEGNQEETDDITENKINGDTIMHTLCMGSLYKGTSTSERG